MDSQARINDGNSRQAAEVESLGSPTGRYRPGVANLVAGIIIGCLLIGGGSALLFVTIRDFVRSGGHIPLAAEQGISWVAVGIASVFVIGLLLGGFLLIRWARSTAALCVYVCPGGFYYQCRTKTVAFPWDRISSVRETILHEHLPLARGVAKHAMPMTTSRVLLVRRIGGEEFGFDGNTLQGHERLGEILRDEARKRDIRWEVVEQRA
jgi:hypothetical protein